MVISTLISFYLHHLIQRYHLIKSPEENWREIILLGGPPKTSQKFSGSRLVVVVVDDDVSDSFVIIRELLLLFLLIVVIINRSDEVSSVDLLLDRKESDDDEEGYMIRDIGSGAQELGLWFFCWYGTTPHMLCKKKERSRQYWLD
ncbi:hypothetical protein C5167_036623 [Papaver somniferum]|uniref:Uncharacterized protein n=1 Tax=Papaver somniferum TaxID=3469 RepID=A0A4Y7I485_PAPSO|nr:hypothetical protein C5167_036623 [Papaver somniferum]